MTQNSRNAVILLGHSNGSIHSLLPVNSRCGDYPSLLLLWFCSPSRPTDNVDAQHVDACGEDVHSSRYACSVGRSRLLRIFIRNTYMHCSYCTSEFSASLFSFLIFFYDRYLGPVQAITVDPTGQYMATSGLDGV